MTIICFVHAYAGVSNELLTCDQKTKKQKSRLLYKRKPSNHHAVDIQQPRICQARVKTLCKSCTGTSFVTLLIFLAGDLLSTMEIHKTKAIDSLDTYNVYKKQKEGSTTRIELVTTCKIASFLRKQPEAGIMPLDQVDVV